jgi:hypothetical protein
MHLFNLTIILAVPSLILEPPKSLAPMALGCLKTRFEPVPRVVESLGRLGDSGQTYTCDSVAKLLR